MTIFFIRIYDYFNKHKIVFYLSLCACVSLMAYFAFQVKFEENVTHFFPDAKGSENITKVFDNLKIKDKIIVMISSADTVNPTDDQSLIVASEEIRQNLIAKAGNTLVKEVFSKVDGNLIGGVSNFIYENLPLFLTDKDYQHFDSLLSKKGMEDCMKRNYSNLLSPVGIALKSYIMKDPLGLGGNVLKQLQHFQLDANYEINEEHIFSSDGSTLLMFVTPVYGTGSTGKNDALIRLLENEIKQCKEKYAGINITYFGGPSVAVYNARQIKADTILTSSIALTIIIIFISLAFKRKRSIPLIIAPVLFGALFALCFIYFIKGSISAIAVGAGSAVMGIALSYSIHMLAHQNHVSSVQQLIREIAYPLTIGSFTTIGAFAGLLFTSSQLLRDFGLCASLTLIGTTLFCLIYLPHFLKGQVGIKQGIVLRFIEKMNSYPFDKNKWLVGALCLLTLVCLFTSQKVGFNDNMMDLNYEPKHLKEAETKLTDLFNNAEKTVLFVSVGKDMDTATKNYTSTNQLLSVLQKEGKIQAFASAQQFIIPQAEQQRRLQKWNRYWTADKKTFLQQHLQAEAARYHFRTGAFDDFYRLLDHHFSEYNYRIPEDKTSHKLLDEWLSSADSTYMLITQVRIKEAAKATVYPEFEHNDGVVVFDKAYFANKWVSTIHDNFYFILYLSSFLIFFALLISYGRIELTLISFLPMLISWIIILGLMGILGIEFNIVNIILSTFIFGIGDDFSIFIMDGLQNQYRTGKKVLNSHKTAIFFSAFTTVIGMATLVFARHPALQSISLISILGMMAVVLVAYSIQPIIYKFFISTPASKGLPPYTLTGLLRTVMLFMLFLTGCIILRLLIFILHVVPIRQARKKLFICQLISIACKAILYIATFVRKEKINLSGETLRKPGILIANHQSFIDILVLLSLSSKIIMVTNHWVWYSPFFGKIIRYADFYYIGHGYEQYVEHMRRKVREGYSIAVFPEGTRSNNGKINRFHKGAFYLAEKLQLDVIPIVLYGNDRIIAKMQPFNIRKGIILVKIMPRISYDDTTFGASHQERAKRIAVYMREEYAHICREKNAPDNPAFYEALVQNYIYKGPVMEWYIRIKVKMEKNYSLFNSLIPMKGQITDIGCGMGALCYMLSLISEERNILGIDYDEDKIAVAQHGWLRNNHIRFEHADALNCALSESDVFILNDVLHYISYENQRSLLKRCAALLRPQGIMIVRDANTSDNSGQRLTRITEALSTRIIKFNQTTVPLSFTSEAQIRDIAEECGMHIEVMQNDKYTSNTIYIFRKTKQKWQNTIS